jgi:NADP-dependent 3-hydroxy acid dehydrogenase YdfG/acyl carrier protein
VAADVTEILFNSAEIKTVIFIADEYQLEDVSAGCQQFLGVIQALIKHDVDDLRLALITHNCQDASNKKLNLAHAALWGMAASLKQEQSQLSVLCLDLDDELAVQETAEYILDAENRETQLAMRQGSYYTPALAVVPFVDTLNEITLLANSVQVVTGGNGGLGLSVVKWLADCGATKIVVAGRNDPTLKSLSVFNALAEQGVTVEMVKCDVTLLADVKQLVNHAQQHGDIQSVFHLAGIRDDGFLQNLDKVSFEKVLSPKLAGAWNLHQAMSDCSPEFMVFFSSVASVFGSAGQAAYAAANAGLDALANYRRQEGLSGLSINWGPWSDVGMAAQINERHKKRLLEQGYQTITPTDGLSALAFAMQNSTKSSQLVVAPIEKKRMNQLASHRGLLRNIARDDNQEKSTLEKQQQPALVIELNSMTMVQRKKRVEQYLLKLVKDMLQVDLAEQLDVDKGLFDLGMDSLTAVEVKDRLARDTGCKLRSTLAFDYPTIRRMAAYLVETLFGDSMQQQVESELPDGESGLDDLSEKELAEMLTQEIG